MMCPKVFKLGTIGDKQKDSVSLVLGLKLYHVGIRSECISVDLSNNSFGIVL